MCLTYNLKAPFEKLPIFPLVNYQQLGSRRNWLWFRALVPWRQEWRDLTLPGHPATPATAYECSQQYPHPYHQEDVEPFFYCEYLTHGGKRH